MTSSSDQTPRERFPNPPGTGWPFESSAGEGPSPRPGDGHDRPTPHAAAADIDRTWALPQPFPTSLVGIWPGRDLPSAERVIDLFTRFVGAPVAVIEEIAPEDDAIEWNRVIAVPGLPSPVIVWTERARAMGPDDLPDPSLANACWVVGCETLLSEQTPLDDFIALMRLLAGSIDQMPAVLDSMTRQWFLRGEIESQFLADEPLATEDVLWRVHAIGRAEELEDEDHVWLYTVGLWRCGKPELEILELPGKHVQSGITLLNGIAALAIAAPLPRPGVVAAIGENLRVTFRPWQEVAEFVDVRSVGSTTDRRIADEPGALNPLMGVRAAVCDPEPRGSFRRIWSWPERAIRLLEEGRGAIYLSDRSTLQLARRARSTWNDFARAFSSVRSIIDERLTTERPVSPPSEDRPAFLVKAAFEHSTDPERGREHLWFEIRRVERDAVEGELLNAPQVATYLRQGDAVRIDLARVSDWRVILPGGGYGPSGTQALREAIAEFQRGQR
ncbi:MAG: DUF2314 domain-containing protein [Phycisphaerales bacterium]